jgi:hypothetical protein
MKNSESINSSIDNYTIIMYFSIAIAISYLLFRNKENFDDSGIPTSCDLNYYTTMADGKCQCIYNDKIILDLKASKKFTKSMFSGNSQYCPLPTKKPDDSESPDEPDDSESPDVPDNSTSSATFSPTSSATFAPTSSATFAPTSSALPIDPPSPADQADIDALNSLDDGAFDSSDDEPVQDI